VGLKIIRRQGVVSLRGEQRRGPPHAAIADVGRFDHQVLRELTLKSDAPLEDSRRTAGVPVHIDERRRGRPNSWSDFNGELGAEIGPMDRGIAEAIAWSQRISVFEEGRRFSVSAGADAVEVERVCGEIGLVGSGSVREAGACTKYRFRVDLIGGRGPRNARSGTAV